MIAAPTLQGQGRHLGQHRGRRRGGLRGRHQGRNWDGHRGQRAPRPLLTPADCRCRAAALEQWLRKYRELQVRAFSLHAVYQRVSETIGLDNNTFWGDADGSNLRYFESTGKDGITKYIMAYSRDEAWATAQEHHRKKHGTHDGTHLRDDRGH